MGIFVLIYFAISVYSSDKTDLTDDTQSEPIITSSILSDIISSTATSVITKEVNKLITYYIIKSFINNSVSFIDTC